MPDCTVSVKVKKKSIEGINLKCMKGKLKQLKVNYRIFFKIYFLPKKTQNVLLNNVKKFTVF